MQIPQAVELEASAVLHVGKVDAAHYPLAKKKTSYEFLREKVGAATSCAQPCSSHLQVLHNAARAVTCPDSRLSGSQQSSPGGGTRAMHAAAGPAATRGSAVKWMSTGCQSCRRTCGREPTRSAPSPASATRSPTRPTASSRSETHPKTAQRMYT